MAGAPCARRGRVPPPRAARPATLLTLLVLAAGPAHARQGPYENALAPADSFAMAGRPERGLAYADSLLRVAGATGNRALEAVVRSRLALVRVAAGRMDEGLAEAARALPLARDVRDSVSWGRALLAEGRAHLFRERLAEAAPPYHQLLALARAARDTMLEGNARLGLAYLDLRANRVRSAESEYRRAIALLERTRDAGSETSARVGLARVLRQEGRTEEAKRSYERIIERCRATGDRFNEADAWNNLGTIEAAGGDPAKAAAHFARALRLGRSLRRSDPSIVRNLAATLVEAGRVSDAADTLEAELARLPADAKVAAYRTRTRLGIVRALDGRSLDAERLLRGQWALRDSVPVDAAAEAGEALVDFLAHAGRTPEALDVALKLDGLAAGRIAREDEVDRIVQLADCERRSGRVGAALARLRRLGTGVFESGSWKTAVRRDLVRSKAYLDAGFPDSAVAAIRAAGDAWEGAASGVRDAEWYEPIGNSAGQLATQTARALLDPRRRAPGAQRAREAFDAVQRFKSRALDWRSRARGAKREPLVTAAALQHGVLRPSEVFVDAYTSTADSAIVFVVDRAEVRVHRMDAFAETASPLDRSIRLLAADDPGARAFRERAAASLAEGLFGPSLDLVRRSRSVVVSLSGYLNAIPVAALPVDPGSAEPLVVKRTLATVPSASWLARRRRAGVPVADPATVVVLARTTDDRDRALDGVRAEARWLVARYGEAGVVNAGDRPLADVLPWLSRGDVLHVASHARTSPRDAWGSAFLLGRGDGEDAWLSAREIATRPLKTKLAVLASCRSTLDRGFSNESVLGLSRAFHAAGVPTALSTLWPVDDEATAAFTRRFYLALEQGRDAAAALRQAQLETRDVPATSAPAAWAGFVLTGDPATRVRPRPRP